MSEREWLTERECWELLDRLFPGGPGAPELLQELAPEGWDASELVLLFHPTREQVIEERLRIHGNLASLAPSEKRPTPEEQAAEAARILEQAVTGYQREPSDPAVECPDLVTSCLWDVFAEHEVRFADGREVDLGSWRGAAGVLAEWLSGHVGRPYDYIDFYMGTSMVRHRADLTPVYRSIFRRLRDQGLDWAYVFPRLYAVDLRSRTEPESPPTAEVLEKERALQRLRFDLDEEAKRAAREASLRPAPEIVEAYRQVYGRYPQGWPPSG